jgi:ATP-binding cassette subfamily B multidrug efflux pump
MDLFFKLGWYFKSQWRRYAAAVTMLIAVDLLEMSIPWITGRIIDHVVDGTLSADLLWRFVFALGGIGVAVYVMRYLWRILLFYSSFHLAEIMRRRLYEHFTRMSPRFFREHRTGDLMARATNDIAALEMTAGEGVLSGIDGLVTGLLVIGIMSSLISWELTALALLPFPFMAWYFMRLGERLHAGFRDAQECFSDLNDRVQESISGIRMVRAFGLERKEDRDFLQIADRAAQANMRVAATDSLYDPAIFITVGSSFLLCIGAGAVLIERDQLTLGQLTSFTMYLGFLIWPMFAYGWLLNILERGSAAWERIDTLLRTPSPVADAGVLREVADSNISIEIDSFQYAGTANSALHDVHLQIPAGNMLGVVGATGAGKSTLISLLLRHDEGAQSLVCVGGNPVQHYTLAALRASIALVPQDPFLFTATIAENIALGRPGVGLDEIRAVAALAAIDHDIQRFPQGYQTLVGERGITLSGGQKQRIAIARALLLDAPILILDDALSAVDVATERSILEHLRMARAGRTTLVFCHRLSAVEDADEIIVLSHGTVTERGNHSSLLALGGWYARMFEYQQLERVVEAGN